MLQVKKEHLYDFLCLEGQIKGNHLSIPLEHRTKMNVYGDCPKIPGANIKKLAAELSW